MKLTVVNIENQGDRDKEVVTLKVDEDCDLRNYLIANCTYDKEDHLTRMFRDTFWFPSRPAKAGDYVLLFTRSGTDADRPNNLGSVSHLVFWNSDHALWHETEDSIMIFELGSWGIQKTRTFVSFV